MNVQCASVRNMPLNGTGIIPGSEQGRCSSCGTRVWLALETVRLMKKVGVIHVLCDVCMPARPVNRG